MEEEEEDEDEALPKSALEIRRQARLEREKRRAAEEGAGRKRPPPKPRAVKADKEFGKWAKASGGLGLKMMKAMGYKGGGLGKHAHGIVNPVKSKLRPQQMGLGYGGYKEKANMTQAELDDTEGNEEKKPRAAQKPKKRPGTNWRATGKKKPAKRVYKTVDELKEEAEKRNAPELVIDMRGPHVRVTSLDKVADLNDGTEQIHGDGWTPTGSANTLPELKWNMDALVEHTESDVHKTLQAITNRENTLKALRNQRRVIADRVEKQKKAAESLELIITLVDAARDKAASINLQEEGCLAQGGVYADTFEMLRERHSEEFQLYGLPRVAFALGAESLKKALRGWRPLAPSASKPTTLELTAMLKRWRVVLEGDEGTGALYQELLEETVMSKLAIALSSCDVRQFAKPITLLEQLRPALPPPVYRHVLLEYVSPRLRSELANWRPTRDPVPVHTWVHPWLDVLPARALGDLFTQIRTKLSDALRAWQPLDGSALVLIEPWRGVWERRDMWDFLSRSILPKLRHLCSRGVHVNPQREDPTPFRAVVRWHKVVPLHALVSMLLTDFFPKWIQALVSWLRSPATEGKFEQILRWNKGWSGQIPDALKAHPLVEAQMRRGLDLMNAAIQNEPLDPILQSMAKAFPAQQEALRREAQRYGEGATAAPAANAGAAAKKKRRPLLGGDLSVKEVLEKLAGKMGLEFMPNLKKGMRDGCEVYTFGRCNIYIKGQTLFVHVPAKGGGGAWKPFAIEDLLQMAK
uniref:G-patch domain-containing protein n=1 Tax=Lotharella oceanica TaxID=641309 RepID=A0A7S2U2W1_9EUKA